MLEQLLTYLHNWFRVRDSADGKHAGTYKVENGGIALGFLQEGQYFRIIGSVFNDGLYIYGETIEDGDGKEIKLKEETFDGTIWALAVPRAVVDLSKDIASWQEKYGDAVSSPYTSESFGGYSYTKSGGANETGGAGGWQNAFSSKLAPWRKIKGD